MLAQTIIDILFQTLIFLPLALGIYFSFKILRVTDLTAEGSFVFGAATYAKCYISTGSNLAGLIACLVSTFAVGLFVGIIQAKNKLPSLIASILTLFCLNSLTFSLMEKPNISLIKHSTIFNVYKDHKLAIVVICIIIISSLLAILLQSKIGIIFRATGSNFALTERLGKNAQAYKMVGLGISNALAGFSGFLTCQCNNFVDITMGAGAAILAIGAVIIGFELFAIAFKSKKFSILFDICSVFTGCFFYFSLVTLFLKFNFNPINIKLIIGIFLIIFMQRFGIEKNHE